MIPRFFLVVCRSCCNVNYRDEVVDPEKVDSEKNSNNKFVHDLQANVLHVEVAAMALRINLHLMYYNLFGSASHIIY